MSAAPKLRGDEATRFRAGQSGNPGGKPRRIFPRVADILKSLDKEPIAELMLLLPKLRERDQAQIWLEILPYVQAKLKQVEPEEANDFEELSTAELIQLVKENLPETMKP